MKDETHVSRTTFSDEVLAQLRLTGLIAVVVIDDVDSAVPLTRALLEAGVNAMELTLRTPTAFESLERIRRECPDMLAGLGTVLTPDQVAQGAALGAAFAVAPGLNPDVVRAAGEAGLPFAPGVVTPSDIETAVQLGCRLLKFFPAEPSGGVKYLKSMAGPYGHLEIEYIPLGGLNEDNFSRYLELDIVPAVGGSWIAPRDAIRARDWDGIAARARRAVAARP